MADLHQKIAHRAFDMGLLSMDSLCEILLEVGRRQAGGQEIDIKTWTEEGWIDAERLTQVIEELNGPQSTSVVESAESLDEIALLGRAETNIMRASFELPSAPAPQGRQDSEEAESEPDELAYDSIAQTLTSIPPAYSSLARGKKKAAGGPNTIDLGEDTMAVEDGNPASDPAHVNQFAHAATEIFHEATLENAGEDPRYVLGQELGRGGGGRVVRAFDQVLGRSVAMKVLRTDAQVDEAMLARFVAEGQATGQLEHPNIVPIYDLGTLPNGQVYYTMREVRRHSLREVLTSLKRNDAYTVEEYTLVRLVTILKQVAQAIHYAHVRGVIHRDLKPGNIMLGDYGEVLVMDWGLARVLDKVVKTDLSRKGGEHHEDGQTMGTPAYMPPEQARGELSEVDEQSDIYSLGAMLYEMLILEPAFSGTSPIEIMWQVVDGELVPPSERASPERIVPEELERICLIAMSKLKADRFASAKELHDRLEDWIEGIQPREAARKTQEGAEAAQKYEQYLAEIEALEKRVRRMSGNIEDWEPIERKRELWRLEDLRDQAQAASARAFGKAVAGFTQALAYQFDHDAARQGLADLYWKRFEQAEAAGDVADTIYFRALVKQYDQNKYQRLFKGNVNLRVFTEPEGAAVTLFPFEEVDRRLVAANDSSLGQTPIFAEDLHIGSYLLVIAHPNHPVIRQPLFLERGRDTSVHIRLPQKSEVQEGFVLVPAGDCIVGGDPKAFDPQPASRVYVASFFCARYPVTFKEYLEWINELHFTDPEEAQRRAPQIRGSEGLLVYFDIKENRWVPDDILIEGPARKLYPVGQGHEYNLPVVGIRAEDAEAYCAWRGKLDNRPYRLPTEYELEKSGRGVDGRVFPWGNRFDATFCKMRFSRPDLPQLEPVGAFVDDSSPYGVRDISGGVQEWCRDVGNVIVDRPLKGGAWNQDARACRLASRVAVLAAARTGGVGMRLVYSYED